ncbi:MAG TPA: HTH domain-containing protein [Gemmataceae bacterium]|nr:HTH domain-containing protein [Gemmataceae bacterium]
MTVAKNSTPTSSEQTRKRRQSKPAPSAAVADESPTSLETTSEEAAVMPDAAPAETTNVEPPLLGEAASVVLATAEAKAPTHVAKRSALDAAAQVLAETGQAMNCAELIAAMSAKGYWQSPKGRTPAGTLYSAVLRELKTKGEKARFRKTERGTFALRENV